MAVTCTDDEIVMLIQEQKPLPMDWRARPRLRAKPGHCHVNGMQRPLFVHALTNDGKTRDATISLLQFEKWDIPFQSLAIFEDRESINRKVLARFSDVCEKQFSSLTGNRDRISAGGAG